MGEKNFSLVRTLLLIVIALWLVLSLFPLYWQIVGALKSAGEADPALPIFRPREWHWENFREVFAEKTNLNALADAFLIAGGTTFLSLALGTLAGHGLTRFARRTGGENPAPRILATCIFAPAAILTAMFFLFDFMPWKIDSRAWLIILYLVLNVPLATWLMTVFFRDVPRELEEAAYLDGYRPFGAFIKVTVPLVLPGMISVAMLCWIFAWSEYLFANLFVGTQVRTLTILIATFTHAGQTPYNLQIAFSAIAIVPPLVLFVLLRRYLVRGPALGAAGG